MSSPQANTEALVPQDKFSTTLAVACSASDTVLYLNAMPTAAEGFLTIDEGLSTEEVIFYTSKGANFVTCPSVANGRGIVGSAVGHSLNAIVKMKLTAEYYKAMQRGDNNIGLHTAIKEGSPFNFFAPGGCVWSISAGLVGTMSSGFVYINGKRLSVAAIGSKTFAINNDTYVDFVDNGDGTATVVYTPQANNTASPALASNSARNAIIVTNGTQIVAGNGGINQGSVAATAPTVSSNILTVCDSLGNMIYNTSPAPTMIGYRQITATFSTTNTSATAITGLSCPVIVPTGRRIKVTVHAGAITTTGGSALWRLDAYDGTPGGGGTLLDEWQGVTSGGAGTAGHAEARVSPAAGSKVYNGAVWGTSAGTTSVFGLTTSPATITVELV